MRVAITSAVLLLALATPSQAQDAKGSADHPLIPRYEDSQIVRYSTQAFTDYRLLVKAAKSAGGIRKNFDSTQELEGSVTRISYRAPPQRSVLEVFRNYAQALTKNGFETLFTCARHDCGGRAFNHAVLSPDLYGRMGEAQADQRYLAAKLSRPEGDVYVALYVVMSPAGGGPDRGRALMQLDVIELKPMDRRMVVLDSGALLTDLGRQGHVAVYGILFDFDKDTLRPDSKPQVDEIAKLLKEQPELRVLIVGHTDAQGSLDYNRALSERRARSVVDALVRDYGIARDRLTSQGVGMAAPVATNRTEHGRALNRRVELVDIGG